MSPGFALGPVGWGIVGAYLLGTLVVGFLVAPAAGENRQSYFLANRNVPWWWAGASIAATTFAADTPLAITGLVATKGLSGNWMWLSWIGVHALVVVYFAERWSRVGVYTDAELVSRRYSGAPASVLRAMRAGLYGVVFNCIVLGWVLRAMVKIVSPFFHWEQWLPGLFGAVASVWPSDAALGTPSDAMTILVLLTIVGAYSTMGGIRGVILTDVFQLGLAIVGSAWFAWIAWDRVGGGAGVTTRLAALYGEDHAYLDLWPSLAGGWAGAAQVGALGFGLYLLVESYANVPADGGGYLMQRLATTRSPRDARKAALTFLGIQYVVRVWPWFMVALAGLVLIPIGHEATALGGAAAAVGHDRELAYPVLMGVLLPKAVLGLVLASLIAAFMSTVDTHLNWGASYVVTDLFLRVRPDASDRMQVRVARSSVVVFAGVAALVSFGIDSIAQAWQWIAALGATLGPPTVLRWLWWRINASAELGAMAVGLPVAFLLSLTDMPYELSLVAISGSSLLGVAAGTWFGRQTDPAVIASFVDTARPIGFWPGRTVADGLRELASAGGQWLSVVAGGVIVIAGMHAYFVGGHPLAALVGILGGGTLLWMGGSAAHGSEAP